MDCSRLLSYLWVGFVLPESLDQVGCTCCGRVHQRGHLLVIHEIYVCFVFEQELGHLVVRIYARHHERRLLLIRLVDIGLLFEDGLEDIEIVFRDQTYERRCAILQSRWHTRTHSDSTKAGSQLAAAHYGRWRCRCTALII